MSQLLWICLAGALGTGLRHTIGIWATARLGGALPYGTLIVNLAGCFLMAAVVHVAVTLAWPSTVRAALTVGFLGGLTTYSAFNHETLRLYEGGAPVAAAVNMLLTVVGALVAGWLGLAVARALLGR